MLVHKDGNIVILDSEFQSNMAESSIVNLGGGVQCEAADCLPVCTECRLSSAPTKSPPPTLHPTVAIRAETKNRPWSGRLLWPVSGLAVGGLALLTAGMAVVRRRRACGHQCFAFDSTAAVALGSESSLGSDIHNSNQQPLLDLDDRNAEPNLVELVPRSDAKAYSHSPASIIVVGRDSMRIKIWSPVRTTTSPFAAAIVPLPSATLTGISRRPTTLGYGCSSIDACESCGWTSLRFAFREQVRWVPASQTFGRHL